MYRFKEIAGDSGDSGDKAPPSTSERRDAKRRIESQRVEAIGRLADARGLSYVRGTLDARAHG